jgi:hypothetical protein
VPDEGDPGALIAGGGIFAGAHGGAEGCLVTADPGPAWSDAPVAVTPVAVTPVAVTPVAVTPVPVTPVHVVPYAVTADAVVPAPLTLPTGRLAPAAEAASAAARPRRCVPRRWRGASQAKILARLNSRSGNGLSSRVRDLTGQHDRPALLRVSPACPDLDLCY